MEFADFAVEIEQILAEATTNYECVVVDEDDIGMMWNFTYEDIADGFLYIEKESVPFEIPTITLAVYLGAITDAPPEILKFILTLNGALINSAISICCGSFCFLPRSLAKCNSQTGNQS